MVDLACLEVHALSLKQKSHSKMAWVCLKTQHLRNGNYLLLMCTRSLDELPCNYCEPKFFQKLLRLFIT